MKLKNVKKLLGDEIYSLWLENVLEYDRNSVNFDKGEVPRLKLYSVVIGAFQGDSTAQGYEFWNNVDTKLDYNYPWILDNRPFRELPRTEYKKSWLFRKEGGRTCIAYLMHDNSMRVYAGCFEGTLEEFEVEAYIHYGNDTDKNYAKHIAWLKELQKTHNEPR